MVDEGLLGSLAAWCGREVVARTTDPVQFSVFIVNDEPVISPLPSTDEQRMRELLGRWRKREVDAVGASAPVTLLPDSVEADAARRLLNRELPTDGQGHHPLMLTLLVAPDGRDAVAFTSLDAEMSGGVEESAEDAVDDEPPVLFDVVSDSLTLLRSQLRMPTRPPAGVDPLWWLLCLWASDATKVWDEMVSQVGTHQAALHLLDRRPDVSWEMVQAARVAARLKQDAPEWPSQKWTNKSPEFIANRLSLRDESVAVDALGYRWRVAADVWEAATGEVPQLDGPALFRMGMIPPPDVDDPVVALGELDDIPDWLGESTVRVATEWDPEG